MDNFQICLTSDSWTRTSLFLECRERPILVAQCEIIILDKRMYRNLVQSVSEVLTDKVVHLKNKIEVFRTFRQCYQIGLLFVINNRVTFPRLWHFYLP